MQKCAPTLGAIPAKSAHHKLWRPTPLLRAVRFEKALQTPAHIYYKYEGASPAGSHKPNTAVARLLQQAAGTKRWPPRPAGQWGSSLALACKLFDLECNVYMVKVSYSKSRIAHAHAHLGRDGASHPSDQTEYGRKAPRRSELPRQLGIAISEAIEDTVKHPHTKYSLGSVLNHFACIKPSSPRIHQADGIARSRLDHRLLRGGSNFAGIAFPFIHKQITGKKKYRIVAVEPSACPSLTKGELRYDFGDTAMTTPLLMMYTLGHDFMPRPSTGGLRYHGMSPMVSHALKLRAHRTEAYHQTKVFEAGTLFARSEGIVPEPESAHAIAALSHEAAKAREAGKKRVILSSVRHGLLDLSAYELTSLENCRMFKPQLNTQKT